MAAVSLAMQTIRSHLSDVTCCDFGKNFTLASGSSDKSVRAWEWSPGHGYREVAFSPIGHHTYGVTDARFSPQGTMLATSSIDGCTVLWNIRTGCKIHHFVQPSGNAVRVCRFTPDSTQLVTGGDDGTVCFWNLAHRSLVRTIKAHEETVQALSVSPDSSFVASGCSQGILHIHDIDDGTLLATQDGAHDMGITAADFSPVPSNTRPGVKKVLLLATCGHDHLIRLWNVLVYKSRVLLETAKTLLGHSSTVLCVRFDPSGTHLASGGLDKTLRVWEVGSTKCIRVLEGHDRYVTSCSFSRDGSLLASGSNDKSVKLWDIFGRVTLESVLVPAAASGLSAEFNHGKLVEERSASEIKLLQKIDCGVAVNFCHFAPGSNNVLAAATGEKFVKIWQQESSGRFREATYSPIEAHRYSVNKVEFSPDGSQLSSCSLDGSASLWNAENGQRSNPSLQSSGAGVRTCRFSPCGRMVVTGGDDERALVWSIPDGTAIQVMEGHTEAVTCAAFSPDSKLLATGDLVGSMRIWVMQKSNKPCSIQVVESAHDLGVQTCDFSPSRGSNDGGHYSLASGGNDALVKLWALKFVPGGCSQISLSRTFIGHGGTVTSVRFSLSGQLLGSAASDKTARIWNVYQGECLFVLELHSSIVTSCAFSSDGSLVATGSLDKSVIIWEMPRDLLVRNQAEESLRGRRGRVEDWTSKDITRWLTWIDLPQIPFLRYQHLTGNDILNSTIQTLASVFELDGEAHLRELEKQLFWLKHENVGSIEDISNVPHELLCPITQEIFREPIICADGFCYERAAIDEWFLSGKVSSPMTNLDMTNTAYVPNIKLRAQICSHLYGEP
ncbi:WD repeat, SAM and U-box domain-containing protein 1-like isoform X2 [Neocloeon triangulifer]|uniref:WD repeat, SAM and U-box domain-containing protein 1-like isoform X2 n=1 Tax=Neocloeon triangulifer TaxID=2078957 RepID=UPI00286F478E|nr:WD repeat, SAM and U-box domain-containing protein 1-like isoform X2 [Neocloeon triangulifer]